VSFLAELVNRILIYRFFLMLLLQFHRNGQAQLLQSFRTAADMAGSGHGISPANVLEIALGYCHKLAPKHNAPKNREI